MLPKELEIIRSDIKIATNILYPKNLAELAEQSTAFLNQAAYHSIQAIEKCLKLIVRANNNDTPSLNETLRTHNIDALLVKIESSKQGFIASHQFIARNSSRLSALNELRYGDIGLTKANTHILYKEARDLVREIEKEYAKGLDVQTLGDIELNNFTNRVFLDTSVSKYSPQKLYNNKAKKTDRYERD